MPRDAVHRGISSAPRAESSTAPTASPLQNLDRTLLSVSSEDRSSLNPVLLTASSFTGQLHLG